MSRLIVCCDGTWQSVAQHSNVSRLHQAVVGVDTTAHYIPGVGVSRNPLVQLEGGMTGVGLSEGILEGYGWLVTHFHAGDRIAVFGFSRGAYTARSLAGMIARVGLVDGTGLSAGAVHAAVNAAYQAYRNSTGLDGLPLFYRPGDPDIPVDFVGVWDTVGALGIPAYAGIPDVLGVHKRYEFLDVTLNEHIRHARHAVALDEMRSPFRPTLWAPAAPGQDMKQVWFPGGHLDVGGGNADKHQSDIALQWMMDEATAAVGIAFDPNKIAGFDPGSDGPLDEGPSGGLLRAAWEVAFQPRPRTVPVLDHGGDDPDIDASAYSRQTAGGYRPTTVLADSGDRHTVVVEASAGWTPTGAWLEPGDYALTANGTWRSGLETVGPEGSTAKWRLSGDLFREVIDLSQALVRGLSGNPDAALLGARRRPDAPWMALAGVVACEHQTTDAAGRQHLIPDVHVLIGDEAKLTVPDGCAGYLHAYPNDAWGCYGNNDGALTLAIVHN